MNTNNGTNFSFSAMGFTPEACEQAAKTQPSFSPLPQGAYLCAVANAILKTSKDGLTNYLELSLEVLQGEYAGRKVWDTITLACRKPDAEKAKTAMAIGASKLHKLRRAVGKPSADTPGELCGVPVVVDLRVVKQKTGVYAGEPRNEVRGYEPNNQQAANVGAVVPQVQQRPVFVQGPQAPRTVLMPRPVTSAPSEAPASDHSAPTAVGAAPWAN